MKVSHSLLTKITDNTRDVIPNYVFLVSVTYGQTKPAITTQFYLFYGFVVINFNYKFTF